MLYVVLQSKQARTLPIHLALLAFLQEWKEPKKVVPPAPPPKKFWFLNEDTYLWDKCPKQDASLSKVSKRSELLFKDAGLLKDPMGRQAKGYLRRAKGIPITK